MKIRINAVLLLLILQLSAVYPQTKQYKAINNESVITYKLTHPLHEIESTSKAAECIASIDAAQKKIQKVSVDVDVTTFDSGNSNRDSHAMEVIDALTYPDADFTSSSIVQSGDSLKVYGKLTFHGITRDIVIAAKAVWSGNKLTVEGGFNISLTAFKIDRPALLLIPVNDTLKFTLKQVFNLS